MSYSYLNVTYQLVSYTVLCNKVLPRSLTNKAGMSWSQFRHVCRHGVIFKKLGIGSLMLASKPVIGFKNSIQVHN